MTLNNADRDHSVLSNQCFLSISPICLGSQTMYLKTIQEQSLKSRFFIEKRNHTLNLKNVSPNFPNLLNKNSGNNFLNNSKADNSMKFAPTGYDKFKNDDLPQTKTSTVKFRTNRMASNPLDPKYPEILAPAVDVMELKFLRDTLNIEDIGGAHSRWIYTAQKKQQVQENRLKADLTKRYLTSNVQRVLFEQEPVSLKSDLQSREFVKENSIFPNNDNSTKTIMCNKNNIRINNITNVKYENNNIIKNSRNNANENNNNYRMGVPEFQVSKRCTDPNNPVYFYYNEKGEAGVLGTIAKSVSSTLHPKLNKTHFGLQTIDIDGAKPRKMNAFMDDKKVPNGDLKVHMDDDQDYKNRIQRKSMKTNRKTNPMAPEYHLSEKGCNGIVFPGIASDLEAKSRCQRMYPYIKNRLYSIVNNRNLEDGKPSEEPIKKSKFDIVKYKQNDIFLLQKDEKEQNLRNTKKKFMQATTIVFGEDKLGQAEIYPVNLENKQNEFLMKYYSKKEKDQKIKLGENEKLTGIERCHLMKFSGNYKSKKMSFEKTNHQKIEGFINRNGF